MLSLCIQRLLNLSHRAFKRVLPFETFAYLALGAGNTTLNLVLFYSLFNALNAAPLALEIATSISFTLTVVSGYWLHSRFAFMHKGGGTEQAKLVRYALVALQGQISSYMNCIPTTGRR